MSKTPEQMSASASRLAIKSNPDKELAPRYDPQEWNQLQADEVVITEKGTASDLPIVDFQLTDKDGKKYFFMITGRLINMVSASIRGANVRNHGVEEP